VIAEQPVATGEDALVEQGSERVGDENAVDEHERLTGAHLLVRKLDAVDHGLLHRALLRGVIADPGP
jgi:hypothetical protein